MTDKPKTVDEIITSKVQDEVRKSLTNEKSEKILDNLIKKGRKLKIVQPSKQIDPH